MLLVSYLTANHGSREMLRFALSLALAAAVSGCVICKSGEDVVRTETRRQDDLLSRRVQNGVLKTVRPELRRAPDGNLVFRMVAEGLFEEYCATDVKIVGVHDEWTSIGLFPGTESMWKGFGGIGPFVGKFGADLAAMDPGDKNSMLNGRGYIPITGHVFANALLLGVPTICSLFAEPFLGYAELGVRRPGEAGLIGVYRYHGDEYEIQLESRKDERVTKVSRIALEGYDVMIGGRQYNVGIEQTTVIPGNSIHGNSVRVVLASVPKYPREFEKELKSIVNVEFHVPLPQRVKAGK